jgi:homoserine O-succinyltransferase
LFVHFQGHPEYAARTLLKEYRRDIKRFLRQERETYPTMPHGYFDAAAVTLLLEFQATALAYRREERLAFFPEAIVAGALQNTWRSSATCVYRNWLHYVLSKKSEKSAFAAMARSGSRSSTLTNHEVV